MIELIKNPLYPDFSDRETVAIEDDYTIRFTDEELDKAVRYLAKGHSIYDGYGMILMTMLADYAEEHKELLPEQDGYIPAFKSEIVPVLDIDRKRKGTTFEVSIYWERKDSTDNF